MCFVKHQAHMYLADLKNFKERLIQRYFGYILSVMKW